MIEIKKLSELPDGVNWRKGTGELMLALKGLKNDTFIAVPNTANVIYNAARAVGIRVQCTRSAGLTYVRLKPEAK